MSERLNKQNDPLSYRKEFLETGSVTIRNFLTPEYAEILRKFFVEGMSSDWWYSSSMPSENGSPDYIRNFEEAKEEIERKRHFANTAMNAGQFAYFFYRTTGNHVDGCYCDECNLRTWLGSEEVLNFINEVSGADCTGYDTLFASKYSEGCFLSPHHDKNLGAVGFVLQLTRDWLPQWGGLLHFMSDDQKQITGVEVPTFNSLTLFHLPEGEGTWHYVSHVNPGVQQNRIAYTGWFKK